MRIIMALFFIPQKVSPKAAGKVLPWVYTMIANAKKTLFWNPSYDI